MIENKKLIPYFILTILYLIAIIPLMAFSWLFIGNANNSLIIFFGTINSIFLLRYYKKKFLLSLLLGFLISSLTICLIYLLWFFVIYSKSLYPTYLFIIISICLCVFLSKNHSKIENRKNINLILLLPTLMILLLSINLKETYPTETENENLIYSEIKIVDKQKKPKCGDTIEVRIVRQPLFSQRRFHRIYKTTTNEKGIAKIQFSKSKNYELTVITKENKLNFIDITAEELTKKKTFIIEE